MTGHYRGPDRIEQKAKASDHARVIQINNVNNLHLHDRRDGSSMENGDDIGLHIPHLPPPVPAQLPPDIADFTGRSAELGQLRDWVERGAPGRAVLITAISGKPGAGKSALAHHFGHELTDRFPDGCLYADLRGTEDDVPQTAGDILGWFLRSLGVRESEVPNRLSERAALYRSRLAGKRVLVVLDNARDEAQVRPLLPGDHGCLALITSRRGLALEGAEVLPLGLFSAEEAIELLRRIAGDRVDAEPEHAAEVVRLCGYLPLAVRIAGTLAARRSWPLGQLAARLTDEHKRLSRLKHGDLDVRAAFALSYRELPAAEARLFRLLGTLVSREFDADLAGALFGGQEPTDAADLLDALTDTTLIEGISPSRFQIHDLIRLFARELLNEEGDAAAEGARDTMLTWYGQKVTTAVEALRRWPDRDASDELLLWHRSAKWLDGEVPALLSAMEVAASARRHGFLATMMAALHPFLQSRRAWSAMERMARALESCAELQNDPELLEYALQQAGQAQWQQGAFDAAVTTYSCAIDMARSGGLTGHEIDAQMMLARVYLDMDDNHRYQETVRSASTLCRETGDRERAVLLDFFAAQFAVGNADVADYDEHYAQFAKIAAEADAGGYLNTLARALVIMGVLKSKQGNPEKAASLWKRALRLAMKDGDELVEAQARENLGTYYNAVRDYQQAREHCERALPIYMSVGMYEYAAVMSLFLARMARDRSDWESAAKHYAQAAQLFEELDSKVNERNMRLELSDALYRLGLRGEAEREFRKARKIFAQPKRSRAEETQ